MDESGAMGTLGEELIFFLQENRQKFQGEFLNWILKEGGKEAKLEDI